jgi:hypothetical protein
VAANVAIDLLDEDEIERVLRAIEGLPSPLASASTSQEVGLAASNLEVVRHRCLRLERIGNDDREAEHP